MRNWFYEHLAMYAAYHRDKRNQMTHHVGVPMIVFSLMLLGATIALPTVAGINLTLSALLIVIVLLVYLLAAPLVGLICCGIYGGLLTWAEQIASTSSNTAYTAFGVLFVLGWIIQFWGHAFEGRKPALFDNMVQIFMAPSFLVAEILFLFGLEKKLRSEIEGRMPRYLPPNEAAKKLHCDIGA